MKNDGADQKLFFIRLAAAAAAIAVLMLLAKVLFFGGMTMPRFRQSAQGQVVSWQDAERYIGGFATVEGTIVATYNSGKACFLNFHPDYKQHFTAVIFASDFSKFPEKPERFYRNKKVRVSGSIKEYNGKPEIIISDPSQIDIVE